MLEKIVSNACEIESVSTKVPLTVATPRTIANAVRTERSLRPARPLRAKRIRSEDRVERVRDRIREHEGAADRRDAEDDRERGQDGAELAAGEASEGEADPIGRSCRTRARSNP